MPCHRNEPSLFLVPLWWTETELSLEHKTALNVFQDYLSIIKLGKEQIFFYPYFPPVLKGLLGQNHRLKIAETNLGPAQQPFLMLYIACFPFQGSSYSINAMEASLWCEEDRIGHWQHRVSSLQAVLRIRFWGPHSCLSSHVLPDPVIIKPFVIYLTTDSAGSFANGDFLII